MNSFNVKFPLSHDPVRKIVRVGNIEIKEPDLRRRKEYDFYWKSEFTGVNPPSVKNPAPVDDWGLDCIDGFQRSTKELHKFYCELLGPRFAYRYQAAHYHTWISPHISQETANLLRMTGRHWMQYNNRLVKLAHNVLPYIQQAERDGLINIIPIIVLFCKSPQDIRAEIGKGAWKRVANNSKTRNVLMMNALINEPPITLGVKLDTVLRISSGVLNLHPFPDKDLEIVDRIIPKRDKMSFRQTIHLITDTRSMLGDAFNPEWSYARMKREHDDAVKAENAKRYSSKSFAEPWSYSADGYTATLLTSPLDIANEGRLMRHCVASYAKLAAKGSYAVFEIDGKERATLGVKRTNIGAITDQCYGACNAVVKPSTHVFAQKALDAYRKDFSLDDKLTYARMRLQGIGQ